MSRPRVGRQTVIFSRGYEAPRAFRLLIYAPATRSRLLRRFFWELPLSRLRAYAVASYYWLLVREMSVSNFNFIDAVREGSDLTLFSLGTYRGRAGWREALTTWREMLDVNLETSEFINLSPAHPAVVVIRMTGRGAASGIGIEDVVYMVINIKDGQAVRGRFYRDRWEALEAVGMAE